MAISYPLTFPTVIRPKRTKIAMDDAIAVGESPFTYEQTVYENQGKRWRLEVTMPTMKRANAEQFISFMGKLRGRKGTFLLGDYDGRRPRGIGTGTPLVMGASQVGDTLITDGWTISKTGILKAGDYIQIGTSSTAKLYKSLDDVNSDGSGVATLTLWPNLRSSPADNAAIAVNDTMTVWRLMAPFEWTADEVANYEITFMAEEAF